MGKRAGKNSIESFNSVDDVVKNHNAKIGKNFTRNTVESVEEIENVKNLKNAGVDTDDIQIKKSVIRIGKYEGDNFTDEQKIIFINSLSQHSVIKTACDDAGITRLKFYHAYSHDTEFKKLVDEAMVLGAINIEDEAKLRAINGVEEEVYFKGEYVGVVHKYSDFLLTFLLKGNFPHKYGNLGTSTEDIESDALGRPRLKVSAAVKSMDTKDINYAALTDEQLRNIVASTMTLN